MEWFEIRFDFRGKRVTGFVHKFGAFYHVSFSDTEILHCFGGLITMDADYSNFQFKGHLPEEPKDGATLHKAIVSALKSRER
jgi:hypothetical protein